MVPAAFSRLASAFLDGRRPHVLGGAGQDGHVLVAHFPAGKGLLGFRKVFELPGDANPFGGRAAGQFAVGAQPGHDAQRAIGDILAGLLEPANARGEHRFKGIDAGFPDLDQAVGQLRVVGATEPVRPEPDDHLRLFDRRA